MRGWFGIVRQPIRSTMQKVTVRVPASTSNFGPGFDCLGAALRIYNEVTVSRGGRENPAAMIAEAADVFFAHARKRSFRFDAAISGDVPVSRGLGSSVTVRLGVMHGLNHLLGNVLSREEIFRICAELEGHPDNAGPAEFGGFNVIRGSDRQRFAVAEKLKFVLLVPDFEVSTKEARALLPAQIDRRSAVASCGNACAITAAFASAKYEKMRGAFADGLHQPFREPLIPFFPDVVSAAENAGALGAFLSGSGSTIAAVTLRNPEKIARAMSEAASAAAQTIITTADNRGTVILR
ncbi:MAG: homoserine kinase [Verrucomicrobiota bacterium]|nr:homoserine kinase [Verrucomicrobiota bacterium]